MYYTKNNDTIMLSVDAILWSKRVDAILWPSKAMEGGTHYCNASLTFSLLSSCRDLNFAFLLHRPPQTTQPGRARKSLYWTWDSGTECVVRQVCLKHTSQPVTRLPSAQTPRVRHTSGREVPLRSNQPRELCLPKILLPQPEGVASLLTGTADTHMNGPTWRHFMSGAGVRSARIRSNSQLPKSSTARKHLAELYGRQNTFTAARAKESAKKLTRRSILSGSTRSRERARGAFAKS